MSDRAARRVREPCWRPRRMPRAFALRLIGRCAGQNISRLPHNLNRSCDPVRAITPVLTAFCGPFDFTARRNSLMHHQLPPASTPHDLASPTVSPTESVRAGIETSAAPAGLSMNERAVAEAPMAVARARAMFSRVLAGWASDVLRLERQCRIGRSWPACGSSQRRSAA